MHRFYFFFFLSQTSESYENRLNPKTERVHAKRREKARGKRGVFVIKLRKLRM